MASIKISNQDAFKAPQVPQSLYSPRLEIDMQPASQWTKLEHAGGLIEYVGSGKLKDKNVLITGGYSGIGRSVAVLMAREGADVTIAHLPEEQADAEATKEMVEAEKRMCAIFAGDLTDYENCRKVVDQHFQSYGSLNVLVNIASKQYISNNFTELDMSEVESTFRTNILQIFAITKFALPYMKKGDSIINTTSVATFSGSPSMVDYAASKGAIVGFTRSLATQLISKGIRVNAVAHGAISTPIKADTRPAKQMENWYANSLLGRLGQPSEVAPTFVFLASSESSLYYGQILHCYPLGD